VALPVGPLEALTEELDRDQLARLALALARCAQSAYQARTHNEAAPGQAPGTAANGEGC
jgi:hypothetical protein